MASAIDLGKVFDGGVLTVYFIRSWLNTMYILIVSLVQMKESLLLTRGVPIKAESILHNKQWRIY